ncbi:hypothetical protein TNCV_1286821 [Trichonephila clavipes]|nr:hypothetical protein TNCV_1286821 [Trichonephila clavipes]
MADKSQYQVPMSIPELLNVGLLGGRQSGDSAATVSTPSYMPSLVKQRNGLCNCNPSFQNHLYEAIVVTGAPVMHQIVGNNASGAVNTVVIITLPLSFVIALSEQLLDALYRRRSYILANTVGTEYHVSAT